MYNRRRNASNASSLHRQDDESLGGNELRGHENDHSSLRYNYVRKTKRLLEEMECFLPSYREMCGDVCYYYAANEVQRIRFEINSQPLSVDELVLIHDSLLAQSHGLALSIRQAKGNKVEPDA